MLIDITSINNGTLSRLELNSNVEIPNEYLEKSEILELKNLKLDGFLEYLEGEFTLKATLTGIMVIEDAISLDAIDYEFSAQIDEEIEDFTKKSQNILDITDVLWQNIVLEVPLKLTNVENFDEYHGDGWKLIGEDSIQNTNNPFKELEEMLREE